ncbi:replicativone DNA helicase [Nonlabens tegetincola]|uniref:Replicative DNA helicase n=1 Tax=Nonlabens tegetincola TaxID=323273 RepID=A0A090Q3K6_9FLAO|nr:MULTISPECIES: replicative DNA helicase [Nonlabens]ALM21956.1 DNA helicase [Nonlabens sp. MIC269]ARN71309.1 replicative DNA helicase [Nonlabens tegetincola]PQJ17187.1 replicative DNA helicase [Nonlabens tegetincola]GAK97669.1 replicativone DNA helicase [Nonlabens tegetincola]
MEKIQVRSNKISGNSPVIALEKGKIPPQAVDLERVVLGALMIDGKGVDEVIDLLSPEVFYQKSHQHIFEAIDILFKEGKPIDLLTVSSQLRKQERIEAVGGDHYLVQLSQLVSSTAHIEYHARIILQKHIQRQLISISSEIIEDAYEESTDVFDLLDTAESKLYEVTQGNIRKSTETAMDLVRQAKQKIEEIANRDGLSGIPTGFTDLDKLTSGWQPSDLIIIAARPGMGKTAFTLSMARNIAIGSNTPVAFFSLEMSSVQLITRLISAETGLSSEKLRTGKLESYEWEQLNVKVKDLEQAPIYIDDTPSLSIFDLRAKCRRLASQYGIKLIMIDYLQLMTAQTNSKGGNREQEISTISRNLKALAKELNVPVIALSQLSRAVESRGGTKRPLLSDLRESGAIEQDADIVSFIYRPEYYGLEEWDDDDRGPTKDQGEFIVAKHRNGATDSIRLKFLGKFGKFDNLDDFFSSPQEIGSKMNAANDDTFKSDNAGIRPSNPGDAFGIDNDDLAF